MNRDNKKPNNDLLTSVLQLMGVDNKRAFRSFDLSSMIDLLYTKSVIYPDTTNGNPLKWSHWVLFNNLNFKIEAYGKKLCIHEDKFFYIPFITNAAIVFVLPKHQASKKIANIIWSLCYHVLQERIPSAAKLPAVLLEYDKKTQSHKCSRLDEVNPDNAEILFNAYVTAICTNDETDFDIEIEAMDVRTRSKQNRARIKKRMKELGVKVLRGKKASVYLRNSANKQSLDVAKLQAQYPDVYKACLTTKEASEYIQLKLNKE